MSYSKDVGEVSARYRSAGEVPSVTYPSGTHVVFTALGSATNGPYGVGPPRPVPGLTPGYPCPSLHGNGPGRGKQFQQRGHGGGAWFIAAEMLADES